MVLKASSNFVRLASKSGGSWGGAGVSSALVVRRRAGGGRLSGESGAYSSLVGLERLAGPCCLGRQC